MKKKLLVASLLALAGSGAMGQSAFEGFYGQIGTGYEGNQYSGLNATGTQSGYPTESWTAGNQNANGLPAVVGLGFNAAVAPSWLLGIGADYSFLKTKTSDYNPTGASATVTGQSLNRMNVETSNRLNIFLSPGYVIDKNKLAYIKAGYSAVRVAQTMPISETPGVGQAPINTAWSGTPSSTVGGYILGLGYKQIVSNGLYGFAEGNYMSYGAANLSATGTTAGVNRGYVLSNSPKLNTMQFLVGVGYKF